MKQDQDRNSSGDFQLAFAYHKTGADLKQPEVTTQNIVTAGCQMKYSGRF